MIVSENSLAHLPLASLALALCFWGSVKVHAGAIAYPALGHFSPEQGTIEVWMSPMADLYPSLKPGEYRSVFQLFSLSIPGHFFFGAHWSARDDKVGLHVSISHATIRDGLYSLPTHGLKWQSGRMHHVAMTWHGREMKLWTDGSEVSRRDQSASFEGPVGNARLIIGHRDFRDTPIVVHAVRMSQTARTASDLKDARPIPDIFTSLLDRFENASAITPEKKTTPDVMSTVTDERGGQLVGTVRFVKEPTAGIALYPEKETQPK